MIILPIILITVGAIALYADNIQRKERRRIEIDLLFKDFEKVQSIMMDNERTIADSIFVKNWLEKVNK